MAGNSQGAGRVGRTNAHCGPGRAPTFTGLQVAGLNEAIFQTIFFFYF